MAPPGKEKYISAIVQRQNTPQPFNSGPAMSISKKLVSTDEHQVLEFLKTTRDFVSAKEVSRRVCKRRCQKEPAWAKRCLVHLANAGHIVMNEIGHFRFKPAEEDAKKKKEKLHLAPQIAKILAQSGNAQATLHELVDDQSE